MFKILTFARKIADIWIQLDSSKPHWKYDAELMKVIIFQSAGRILLKGVTPLHVITTAPPLTSQVFITSCSSTPFDQIHVTGRKLPLISISNCLKIISEVFTSNECQLPILVSK